MRIGDDVALGSVHHERRAGLAALRPHLPRLRIVRVAPHHENCREVVGSKCDCPGPMALGWRLCQQDSWTAHSAMASP